MEEKVEMDWDGMGVEMNESKLETCVVDEVARSEVVVMFWVETTVISGEGVDTVSETKISVVKETGLETEIIVVDGGRGLICAMEVMDEHSLTKLDIDKEIGTDLAVADLLVVSK